MPAIEVGRICVKITGREAGKKCVIVDVSDRSFAVITGPKKVTGVRRRRVNINHVEPLTDTVQIERDATDEEVEEALKTAGKLEMMSQELRPTLSSP
jgi:large subunit ribosomal protein L14e